jgi:sec-independent protein translocase protein TatB
MKTEFEDAARNVEKSVHDEVNQASTEMNQAWSELGSNAGTDASHDSYHAGSALMEPPLDYRNPKKNWRVKRGTVPQWYRQRHGVRAKAQSGAARVARFRPSRSA